MDTSKKIEQKAIIHNRLFKLYSDLAVVERELKDNETSSIDIKICNSYIEVTADKYCKAILSNVHAGLIERICKYEKELDDMKGVNY